LVLRGLAKHKYYNSWFHDVSSSILCHGFNLKRKFRSYEILLHFLSLMKPWLLKLGCGTRYITYINCDNTSSFPKYLMFDFLY
jgi:hypothetical protein